MKEIQLSLFEPIGKKRVERPSGEKRRSPEYRTSKSLARFKETNGILTHKSSVRPPWCAVKVPPALAQEDPETLAMSIGDLMGEYASLIEDSGHFATAKTEMLAVLELCRTAGISTGGIMDE